MASSTLLGLGAGQSLTTGDFNIAIGANALSLDQTGSFNVAVGALALRASTAGGSTAVGYSALYQATTGERNTALGQSAGAQITTGARNVLIGWAAGWSESQLASVNDSIVIGHNCHSDADGQIVLGDGNQNHLKMFGISMARWEQPNHNLALGGGGPPPGDWVGQHNLAIGEDALSLGLEVYACLAIGNRAMMSKVGGGGCVAIGGSAMRFATDIGDTTAVGNLALERALTGVGDTAVGFRALQNATVARNNSAVGDSALWLTQGFSNVGIGYRVAEYVASGDNCVYIGTAAGVNRANGDRTVLIGMSAGGISTVVPDPLSGDGAATVGDRVVGIGYHALLDSLGSDHVAVGDSAGKSLVGGAECVFIGSGAGHNSLQKGDAVNSIAIGAGSYTEKDNQVVLGNASVVETVLQGVTRHAVYAVADLPAALSIGVGARAFVSDAVLASFGEIVEGEGSLPVPVFCDGTDWRVG